jgi:Flp pilus assembly protein TadG
MHSNRLRILALVLASVLPLASSPANASADQTLGNLSGKWTIPKTIKLPKSNCGTFNATFRLGVKSLKPGVNATDSGYSTLILVTPMTEGLASATASWSKHVLSNGTTSQNFKVKFCKTDWQNSAGDFNAGVDAGRVEVAVVQNDAIVLKASVRFVK